jgi:hypothetical protein
MAYLIHFNQNHSSKDGRFVSGDGDGDGIANDHQRQVDKKYNDAKKAAGKKMGIGKGLAWGTVGGWGATALLSAIAESSGSDAAAIGSWVTGISSMALGAVSAGVYDSGRRAMKKATTTAILDSASNGDRDATRKYLRERDKYTEDRTGSTYYIV